MISENKKNELIRLTRSRIYLAQSHLDKDKINEELKKSFSAEAEIPGFEQKPMKFGSFVNKEFVALMTDIRSSKKIIESEQGVSKMFQIFYSYSAVIANIVDTYDGTATEFLGDGVLCLFPTDEGTANALTKAFRCSIDILNARHTILNPIYRENFLPQIDYGIGVDYGITIVTKFGYKGDNDLKAFGKSVYNVSRLCKGINVINFSPKAYNDIPKHPNGTIAFGQSYDSDNNIVYKILNPNG